MCYEFVEVVICVMERIGCGTGGSGVLGVDVDL
jgi:hypothetical protein